LIFTIGVCPIVSRMLSYSFALGATATARREDAAARLEERRPRPPRAAFCVARAGEVSANMTSEDGAKGNSDDVSFSPGHVRVDP